MGQAEGESWTLGSREILRVLVTIKSVAEIGNRYLRGVGEHFGARADKA
jgi:hypothetical protein